MTNAAAIDNPIPSPTMTALELFAAATGALVVSSWLGLRSRRSMCGRRPIRRKGVRGKPFQRLEHQVFAMEPEHGIDVLAVKPVRRFDGKRSRQLRRREDHSLRPHLLVQKMTDEQIFRLQGKVQRIEID